MSRDFARRCRTALADPVLPGNVLRATDISLAHRETVVLEREDWEELRERAAAIRDEALADLDGHLARLRENLTRLGATVHLARTGRAARRIIADLARRRGCSRILKAKSMATEEIGLGAHLEAKGFSPLETDLGEYIVQLAGEPPSHITAPALHRSTEQIRDLFAEHGVGEGVEDDGDRTELARRLSLAAREHLRDRLKDADLGITGANFLVAETGTVVLLENEGNIRFTTTSPPLQVVLAGVDKVIPRFEDLSTLLALLPRSATGQRATSYVSLITGPLTELHVVLLDNGRRRRIAEPENREIFSCIRCGACMNVCPVYRSVGGHAYGSTYPGPIGALLTPLLRGRRADFELPGASTLCGACTDVCPVKIDLPGHLLRLRNGIARGNLLERAAFRGFRFLMGGERRYRFFRGLARLVPPRMLAAWTRHREAPRVARRTFKEIWRKDGPEFS